MTKPVKLVIVGMGGYGEVYLESLLETEKREHSKRNTGETQVSFEIVGAVDPEPDRCRYIDQLRSMKVPFFPSLEAFYQHARADLAVISSPIHFHCAQTCLALAQGSHVLCEKPAAATVQDVDQMIRARDEAGLQVSIGYQWSFSSAIKALKSEIIDGRFGAPRVLKNLCLWPRDTSYYARNSWAGALQTPEGAWILDSPVNNAMAHYLHNMLFLLGPTMDESATPGWIQAELYCANKIENYDTAALRIHTVAGAELLFYGAHPIKDNFGPAFSFEFERALVTCDNQGAPVEIRFANGDSETLPHPDEDDQCTKLWACMHAIVDKTPFPCGLEAARAQTVCMNGAQESLFEPAKYPTALLRKSGKGPQTLTWVEGLAETLETAWKLGKLPSEHNASWAKPGRIVDLATYDRFKGY